MLTYVVLAFAGLGAGMLNAIAGGGTFLSFPALVWAGVPPILANATATFAALPGYASSAWAYRADIAGDSKPCLMQLVAVAVVMVALVMVGQRRLSGPSVPPGHSSSRESY